MQNKLEKNKSFCKKKFGEELAELRTKRGFTQGGFAEKLEVCRTTIIKYETGISTPSLEKAFRIKQVLGITWSTLLGEGESIDLKLCRIISGLSPEYKTALLTILSETEKNKNIQ